MATVAMCHVGPVWRDLAVAQAGAGRVPRGFLARLALPHAPMLCPLWLVLSRALQRPSVAVSPRARRRKLPVHVAGAVLLDLLIPVPQCKVPHA